VTPSHHARGAGCRARSDLQHRRAQRVESGEGHFPARVAAVEAHLLEEAIDDAEKILVVVDWLIRTHTDTLLRSWVS
jgi:hypothetical protein